jgi:hypothetical protein
MINFKPLCLWHSFAGSISHQHGNNPVLCSTWRPICLLDKIGWLAEDVLVTRTLSYNVRVGCLYVWQFRVSDRGSFPGYVRDFHHSISWGSPLQANDPQLFAGEIYSPTSILLQTPFFSVILTNCGTQAGVAEGGFTLPHLIQVLCKLWGMFTSMWLCTYLSKV